MHLAIDKDLLSDTVSCSVLLAPWGTITLARPIVEDLAFGALEGGATFALFGPVTKWVADQTIGARSCGGALGTRGDVTAVFATALLVVQISPQSTTEEDPFTFDNFEHEDTCWFPDCLTGDTRRVSAVEVVTWSTTDRWPMKLSMNCMNNLYGKN